MIVYLVNNRFRILNKEMMVLHRRFHLWMQIILLLWIASQCATNDTIWRKEFFLGVWDCFFLFSGCSLCWISFDSVSVWFYELIIVWVLHTKKRRRTLPYAFEVHHKPAYNTEKPTPVEGRLSLYTCALLYWGGDFKGNRAICLHLFGCVCKVKH